MRVLLVSPHFPPTNAADHQRVRMSLRFFEEFGWQATVLAVHAKDVEAVREPLLEATVPESTRVVRTNAYSTTWTRPFGAASLAMRAYPSLQRAVTNLLASEKYDAVFFSTTQFPVMALGRNWLRQFGVPYVLDFQDPWRNDYYDSTGIAPPGGKFKFAFAKSLARILEPRVLREAAHVVSVSPAYPEMLMARYAWLGRQQFTVLPFGAAESDFDLVRRLGVKQNVFDPADGKRHWVYVGRGGADMALSLQALFEALKVLIQQNPGLADQLRLHFIGTAYAPENRAEKTVEPLAVASGLGGMVIEQTARLPYLEALRCLLDADALIVPGSDDCSYTASKIYPYILANKPLLAVFHEQSSVIDVLNKTKAGIVVGFKTGEAVGEVGQRILQTGWLSAPLRPSTDWSAFEPYTAREMTRRLCDVFEKPAQSKCLMTWRVS